MMLASAQAVMMAHVSVIFPVYRSHLHICRQLLRWIRRFYSFAVFCLFVLTEIFSFIQISMGYRSFQLEQLPLAQVLT